MHDYMKMVMTAIRIADAGAVQSGRTTAGIINTPNGGIYVVHDRRTVSVLKAHHPEKIIVSPACKISPTSIRETYIRHGCKPMHLDHMVQEIIVTETLNDIQKQLQFWKEGRRT